MRTIKQKRTSKDRDSRSYLAGPERTEMVLQVARKLFLSRGYEGVSLGMIVADAGGSLRDIYREFGGKDSLFRKVVEQICEETLKPMRPDDMAGRHQNESLEDSLFRMGQLFLNAILSPNSLSLHRLIVSEAIRFPELPKVFMRLGPESVYGAVADFLRERFAAEGFEVGKPAVAARLFLDMMTGDLQLRALTGSAVAQAGVDERIRECVSVFIAGIKQTSKK